MTPRRRLFWTLAAVGVVLALAVPAAISLARDDASDGTPVAAAALPSGTSLETTSTAVARTWCRSDLVETIEGEIISCRDATGRVICSTQLPPPGFMCPPDTSALTTLPPLPNRPPPPTTTANPNRPTVPEADAANPDLYCRPGELIAGPATTDKQAYRIGLDQVLVQATVVNTSRRTCLEPGSTRSITVRNAAGEVVYGVGVTGSRAGPPPALRPGEEFVIWMYWEQRVRGERRADAGAYTATLSFGQAESEPATFTLVAP